MSELQKININNYIVHIYDVDYIKRIKNIYGFIYVTTNLVNNKRYIGQKKISKGSKWENYLGSGLAFKKALKKYGKDNFDRKIIEIAFSYEELNMFEYFYSVKFNTLSDRQWYNLCYGGGGLKGIKFTEEHKNKLKQSKIGDKNPNYNRIYTEEEKRKFSERMKGKNNPMYGTKGELSPNYGRHHSKGTKRKMSEAAKGEKNHNYNKKWTEEYRERYKELIKQYPKGKSLAQYDLEGNFVKFFNNVLEASNVTGIPHSSICSACRGERKVSHGYQWIYCNKYNIPRKLNTVE